MGVVRFLHTADLHLDSPLRGLERYEGAPVETLRQATRRAFENAVALAIEEAVDFVLVAGDVYDGDWKDYNTGLFFARQISRLRDARIRVCLIKGNHDAASQIGKELALPENARVLGSRRCETVVWDDLGVAIHGQSLSHQAVTEDLASRYPLAQPGYCNIGLLHTSATGREGHETYAPCSIDGLRSKGYDYWALGHVHRREVLHEDPWIVFPGNTQGRHIRETGEKSVTLATVEGGRVRSCEARAVDVARWAECVVDAEGQNSVPSILDAARRGLEAEADRAGGRLLAARLLVRGRCRAHGRLMAEPGQFVNECRQAANDLGRDRVWVEKVKLQTRATLDVEELAQRQDALGDLTRYVRALADTPEELAEVSAVFDDLRVKLPPELRQGEDTLGLSSPEGLKPLLAEVEQILLPRLLEQEET